MLVVDALTAFGVSFWLYVEVLWTLAAVVSIAGLAMRSAPGWLSFRLFVLDALPVAFLVSGVVLALAGGTAHAALWALVPVSSLIYAVLVMISIQIVVWLASRATEVVAEGIESEADLAVLRRLGTTFGQSYALGRPGELPSRGDRPGEPSLTALAAGM